jgi:hypothetical protein
MGVGVRGPHHFKETEAPQKATRGHHRTHQCFRDAEQGYVSGARRRR